MRSLRGKSLWHGAGNSRGVRRPILRALAGSLALTFVTLGLLSASARLASRLTNGWFGPLPAFVEVEEAKSEPEPLPTPTARAEILPRRVAPVAPKTKPILADPAPTKPTERLSFRPFRENGKVTGLEYRGGSSGSLFDLLGLQQGDILIDINGYSLDDPEDGLRAYAALRRAQHLRVKVVRDGRPLELVIHIL